MRMPATFLKTRIARRIFGLFLLCAVVPTALIATASYWMVTRELKAQARTQVAQAAKVSGTLVLARLHEAERALDQIAGELARDSTFVPRPDVQLAGLFHALSLAPAAQAPRVLYGPGTKVSPPDDDVARRQLDAGRAVLVVQHEVPVARIVLLRRVGPVSDGGPLLAGEIAAGHLWGDEGSEPLVPPETDFCVYVTGVTTPLHCTGGMASRDGVQGTTGTADVSGSSELFLGFEFAAPTWTVSLTRPLESFSAPIEFRRLVLLTLALGIWLVVFASNVLLRHRLDPVARLQEATRRVADGDFSASVTLTTRDELDDLAQSFNAMAGRLRSQFALLRALHEVDRKSLLAQTGEDVAREAVVQFPRLLEIEEAVIALRAPTADGPHDAVVISVGLDGVVERRELVLPPSSLAELESGSEYQLVGRSQAPPGLIEALGPMRVRSYLVLPLLERQTCFAAVVLTAPSSLEGFSELDARRARQMADQAALAIGNARLMERLNAMSWGTLQALARSIDAASPWTAGHSERVTLVGIAIGRQLGLAPDFIDQLHRGGLLHDVGKIGVPAAILDKPGKLTDAEFDTIRAHPVIGARILEPILAYEDVIPIVRHHHERFNGTGYPDRLAGRAIPYLARVLSVADVYDALVSRRPYRDGWTHEAAVSYIASRAGVEFDPGVVAAFVQLVASPEWEQVTDQLEPVPVPNVPSEGAQ